MCPRIWLASKENDKTLPCVFQRKQFPLRPCFAMTINKSQGQSLNYVGLDLKIRPCFAHGHLYVALSRVTARDNLKVIGPEEPHARNRLLHNVVYSSVLREIRAPEQETDTQAALMAIADRSQPDSQWD